MWAGSPLHHAPDAAAFVTPLCTSFRGAAEYLEGDVPSRHERIMIYGMNDYGTVDIESDEDPNNDEEGMVARFERLNALNSEETLEYHYGRRSFTRFITALGKQEPYLSLRTIDLSNVVWAGVQNGGFNKIDLEHLFTNVLPHHPTLEGIRLRPSIPAEYLQMLTSSIQTEAGETCLREIYITVEGHFNDEKAQAIASMLRRNVPLTRISLGGTLSANGCAMVCRAVAENTNLQSLDVLVTGARADTLAGVLASSSLRTLRVRKRGPFSPNCLQNLAQDLRTNTTLQVLQFFRFVFDFEEAQVFWRPLLTTLESYNYTLTAVETGAQITPSPMLGLLANQMIIAHLLQRNGFMRRAVHKLQTRNYHMPTAVLPFLLERVGPVPSLLYHILRHVHPKNE
jgi:hypothetical protein